ncbi:MAG: hypothetical protein ACM3S5_01180 [Rhodospirillales bacterium]
MKMAFTGKSLFAAFLSIAAASGAEKDRPKFTPGPIESYPCRQTIQNLTVAAQPFRTDAETKTAFGKLNPNRYGVLPILVIIQNDTDKAVSLETLKVEFLTPDRERIEATPAADVPYLQGPNQPKIYGGPIPGRPPYISKKKGPLAVWEIEGRAFTARMLPPKETASGFFYFRVPYRGGSTLFVRGIREAATGNEWFYFEIPLDDKEKK